MLYIVFRARRESNRVIGMLCKEVEVEQQQKASRPAQVNHIRCPFMPHPSPSTMLFATVPHKHKAFMIPHHLTIGRDILRRSMLAPPCHIKLNQAMPAKLMPDLRHSQEAAAASHRYHPPSLRSCCPGCASLLRASPSLLRLYHPCAGLVHALRGLENVRWTFQHESGDASQHRRVLVRDGEA